MTQYRRYARVYDASNRLDEILNSSDASMYKYSYNGAAGDRGVVTGRNQGAGYNVQNYTVGLDDRGRALTGPSVAAKTYKYDGLGRRTQIKRGSAETNAQVYTQAGKLVWGHVLAEGANEGPQASRYTKYVYLGNHLIARQIEDDLSPLPSDEALNYLHTDGLGSPVAATTPLGALVAGSRVLHEPYGLDANSLLREQGPGFTGHVVDSDTGLSYMQQRYYVPIAGRFLSPDPIATDASNGANFNRYWYANNNPYKYIDPDGRQSYGYGTNQPAQILGCDATGTCDPSGKRGDEIVSEDAKTIVVGQAVIVGVATVAVVAQPAIAATATVIKKDTVKYMVCGVLSLCGKDKADEVAEDIKRTREITQRISERLRKSETKIEPSKPRKKLPVPEPEPPSPPVPVKDKVL